MADALNQTVKIIKRFEPIRGLEVVVWETIETPREVCVVVLGAVLGWHDVTQIDSTDAGAVAHALSLAELTHDTLGAVECSWFAEATA